MSEPFVLLDAILRGMALALLLLVAARLVTDRPRSCAAQAGVLLMLGLAAQLLSSMPLVEQRASCAWQSPWIGVSVANAVSFWLFVAALFDDEFRWRPVHAAAWLFAFVIGTLHCALLWEFGATARLVSTVLLRAVPLVFAVAALVAAGAHWRDDLVEARRQLRRFILVGGVIYTLAMLAARLASPHGRLSSEAALVDVAMLLGMVAVASWQLLRIAGADLFPLPPDLTATATVVATYEATPLPPPDAADERLAAALERSMRQDRIYRSENLTVASLAATLAVPEYRLRRLINQRLGHRNFNAFVNAFRLEEAQAALADPARRDRPVLSIALDAGFQSIGPFNRAFKAATGLTPSEYRQQKLADS